MLVHLAQPGDTLLEMGLFYGVTPQELAALNDIEMPHAIGAGLELNIPIPILALQDAAANENIIMRYVVQRGDTLFRIATRFSVPMSSLAAANEIVWADRIYVGQELIIPGEGYVPPDEPSWAQEALPESAIPIPTLLEGKQIIVVLSQQRVYAFENGVLLRHFLVSTGLPATPTVRGDYSIYYKTESTRMTGPGYDLPGVPWTMSHGCVNMRTSEAEWLYHWSPVDTAVRVIW